jgi:hypothetical protein
MIKIPALFNNTETAPFADINIMLDISQYDVREVCIKHYDFIIPYYIGDKRCTMIASGGERFISPLSFDEVCWYFDEDNN